MSFFPSAVLFSSPFSSSFLHSSQLFFPFLFSLLLPTFTPLSSFPIPLSFPLFYCLFSPAFSFCLFFFITYLFFFLLHLILTFIFFPFLSSLFCSLSYLYLSLLFFFSFLLLPCIVCINLLFSVLYLCTFMYLKSFRLFVFLPPVSTLIPSVFSGRCVVCRQAAGGPPVAEQWSKVDQIASETLLGCGPTHVHFRRWKVTLQNQFWERGSQKSSLRCDCNLLFILIFFFEPKEPRLKSLRKAETSRRQRSSRGRLKRCAPSLGKFKGSDHILHARIISNLTVGGTALMALNTLH